MTNICQLSNNTKVYLEQFECILGNMIREMSSVVLTDSISASFIAQMIPHHRAAIAMSESLLRYTTDIPLQNIALNIIREQQKSIENMLQVYPGCQSCINTEQERIWYERNNTDILNTMFCDMSMACSDNHINANFMREMIPHHRGAVRMSENALHFPLCQDLIPLLDAIIASQKKGIRQMQQLLSQMPCR